MNHKAIYAILAGFILVLVITNWAAYDSLKRAKAGQDQALVLLEQTTEGFKVQAEEWAGDLRRKKLGAFQEILKQIETFKELSGASEKQITELILQRKEKYSKLQKTPKGLSPQARVLLGLDDRLLEHFQDYAQLQSVHREKLMQQFRPLVNDPDGRAE